MITHERLTELLQYNAETGMFTWKIATSHRVRVGSVAGTLSAGYVQIGVDKVIYYAHRLAWFYTHEEWAEEIDHLNECKADNRLANLRATTHALNMTNQSKAQRNSSTHKRGVRRHNQSGKYVAEIRTNNVTQYLGIFNSVDKAYEVYLEAKREMHPFWVEKAK